MIRRAAALVALLAAPTSGAGAPDRTPRALPAVARDALCVTHGELRSVGGTTRIAAPAVRAFGRATSGDGAALRFAYLGPTATVSRLASGTVRRQIGLKLRAQDGCNLVYVMWRIAPRPEVVVQLKRNPGARTHAECGTRGYVRIAPARAVKVAAPEVGSRHTLQAEIDGAELVAWIDGSVVWRGALPDAARDLAGGPAGMRSDNVAAEVELLASPASDDAAGRCPGHATEE